MLNRQEKKVIFFCKGILHRFNDTNMLYCRKCTPSTSKLYILSNFSSRRFLVLIYLNFKMLLNYGIVTQTPHQIEPIEIWPPGELVKAYEQLGINAKLKLTG